MSSAIRIAVLANASQAKRELNDVAGTSSKVGSKLKSFGKVAALGLAAAGAGAAIFAKSAISAASDAQQSLGATETVFGKFSKDVIATSDQAATKFGLSAHSYRENANLIGSLLKNQGVATKDLGGETQNLIGHAADMAATFGGTTKNSVDALGAALKGEFERLESYGVSIKASTVSTLLAARGQDKLTGAAADAAKRTAILDLVMKQSKSSVGAFGRESNTLAHQQQVLGAKFENIKAKLGTFLLPLITKLAVFVSDKVLPALAKWGNAMRGPLAKAVDAVKTALNAVQPIITRVVDFMKKNPAVVKTFAIVLGVLGGALVVVSVAMAVLNAVMLINPFVLVVVAIAALAAGLVYAYKKSETFRKIVDKAWAGIRKATAAVFPVVKAIITRVFGFLKVYLTTMFTIYKTAFKVAWAVIKAVTKTAWTLIKTFVVTPIKALVSFVRNPISTIKTAFSNAWTAIKTKTAETWNAIKTKVVDTITALMEKVRGIKDKVTGAFSGAASWLYNAGKDIIQGLIDGVGSLIGTFTDKLKKLTDLIPDIKGPPSRDRRLLYDNGRLIMQGLIHGFERDIPGVKRTLEGLTRDIGGFGASIDSRLTLDARSVLADRNASGSHNTISVRFTAAQISAMQRGREIVADIDAFESGGGRRAS